MGGEPRRGWADGSPYGVADSGCRVMLVAFKLIVYLMLVVYEKGGWGDGSELLSGTMYMSISQTPLILAWG